MAIKEVTPIKSIQNPNTFAPKPIPQKTPYTYAGKESLLDAIRRSTPKQLTPSKRIGSIFGGIFLLVIIIAGFQFPLQSLLSGNIDVSIKIGYPMTFLELKTTEAEASPLKPLGLILDIILYIFVAYLLDVALNLILNNSLFKSRKEIKKSPIIFKDQKSSVTEKVIGKVIRGKELK